SDRTIPLNEDAIKLLALVKELNTKNGIDCSDNALIFQRIIKGNILPCNIRCFDPRISRYCRELGIERKSMHDMRRTFATLLYRAALAAGEKRDVILEKLRCLMGHTSVSQTKKYIVDLDENADSKPLVDLLCKK
ncbi:MAG: tyrosine-type recombinase/integrase, partial [Acetatifactor sp.]|nr:tyrosine-type recombinase/integrase [Acetatifactor sp.]